MIDAPLLAYAAGMVAAFNPCGFAMLPVYLSYYVCLDEPEAVSSRRRVTFRRANCSRLQWTVHRVPTGHDEQGKSPSMTQRPCPACGRRVAVCRGHVDGIAILRCGPCSTYYTADIEVTDFADEYEDYYNEENLAAPDFVARSLDRIFSGFNPYRSNNRMLDVGFGGAFTMLAGVRGGWDVEGVEISEPAVKNAQALGLNAIAGDLQEVGYPDNHFDVVVCSEVFEHVPHPRQLAEEIVRVLRPGGLMWATTPHGLGISSRVLGLEWSVMCPPEHLQLFSRKGLRYLLTESGFKLERLITENLNPFEMAHDFKARLRGDVPNTDAFDRVHSNYEILETVYSRKSLTMAKHAVHALLHAARMGDSLKVWATKTSATGTA